jgi:predicted HicB family RNase H-like nuclease
MSDLLEYKGYSGTVLFSAVDNVLHGKVLGIRSLLSYEGNSLESLRNGLEDVIDDYLKTCAEEGVEPEKPYFVKHELKNKLKAYGRLSLYADVTKIASEKEAWPVKAVIKHDNP